MRVLWEVGGGWDEMIYDTGVFWSSKRTSFEGSGYLGLTIISILFGIIKLYTPYIRVP